MAGIEERRATSERRRWARCHCSLPRLAALLTVFPSSLAYVALSLRLPRARALRVRDRPRADFDDRKAPLARAWNTFAAMNIGTGVFVLSKTSALVAIQAAAFAWRNVFAAINCFIPLLNGS